MIALRKIKADITALLKSKFNDYKVYWDNVDKAQEPYFYCELSPIVKTIDRRISERSIEVDIMGILSIDSNGKLNRSLLFSLLDELDILIRPVVKINDRYITVLNVEMTIHDDILHYIFSLNFADEWTDEELGYTAPPLMANLDITLNERKN